MSFEPLTQANLYELFKELSKEYKRIGGSYASQGEIIIVGGAAILAGYGFRDSTYDIDCITTAASYLKDAAVTIAERYNLPTNWFNSDFRHTDSFTPKLREFSVYWRQFSHLLTVRIVTAEYLIAMKLMAGREYKNDLSDIVGILMEHEKRGTPITYESIVTAVTNLYGSMDNLPAGSVSFIKNLIADGDYAKIYFEQKEREKLAHQTLSEFKSQYPNVLSPDNITEVLRSLQDKTNFFSKNKN